MVVSGERFLNLLVNLVSGRSWLGVSREHRLTVALVPAIAISENFNHNCLKLQKTSKYQCGNCAKWSGSFDAAHLERAKNEESANRKGLNSMGINQRGCNEVERSTGTDRDRREAVRTFTIYEPQRKRREVRRGAYRPHRADRGLDLQSDPGKIEREAWAAGRRRQRLSVPTGPPPPANFPHYPTRGRTPAPDVQLPLHRAAKTANAATTSTHPLMPTRPTRAKARRTLRTRTVMSGSRCAAEKVGKVRETMREAPLFFL
ncbi:hypothetical protein B0H11DRAFT_1927927 [Mycena galericulata]|nr:hypothetical protein B0H11DRAFT_1927927 [Mycena galericulata]